jgi:hypothetical protein
MPSFDPVKRHEAAVKAAATRAAKKKAAAGWPPPPVAPKPKPAAPAHRANQNPFGTRKAPYALALVALNALEDTLAAYLAENPKARKDEDVNEAFIRYRKVKGMALGAGVVGAEQHAWLRKTLIDCVDLIKRIL